VRGARDLERLAQEHARAACLGRDRDREHASRANLRVVQLQREVARDRWRDRAGRRARARVVKRRHYGSPPPRAIV
jgi:hypothetical protein